MTAVAHVPTREALILLHFFLFWGHGDMVFIFFTFCILPFLCPRGIRAFMRIYKQRC